MNFISLELRLWLMNVMPFPLCTQVIEIRAKRQSEQMFSSEVPHQSCSDKRLSCDFTVCSIMCGECRAANYSVELAGNWEINKMVCRFCFVFVFFFFYIIIRDSMGNFIFDKIKKQNIIWLIFNYFRLREVAKSDCIFVRDTIKVIPTYTLPKWSLCVFLL